MFAIMSCLKLHAKTPLFSRSSRYMAPEIIEYPHTHDQSVPGPNRSTERSEARRRVGKRSVLGVTNVSRLASV